MEQAQNSRLAMRMITTIGPFGVITDSDSLFFYVEIVSNFIRANDIEDNKKVAVFFSIVGSKTFFY